MSSGTFFRVVFCGVMAIKQYLLIVVTLLGLSLAQTYQYALFTFIGNEYLFITGGSIQRLGPTLNEVAANLGVEGENTNLMDVLNFFGSQGWQLVDVGGEPASEYLFMRVTNTESSGE
jgi:hypothetical protein